LILHATSRRNESKKWVISILRPDGSAPSLGPLSYQILRPTEEFAGHRTLKLTAAELRGLRSLSIFQREEVPMGERTLNLVLGRRTWFPFVENLAGSS
jgi:hypothetical protein